MKHFLFPGMLAPRDLALLFARSDLHLYLTVPFVLSWSLMDSLASGCTVLASNTAPVQEMIRAGENGLLADFFDVEDFARQAVDVLKNPGDYRHLGRNAARMIEEHYSLERVLPRMLNLYDRVVKRGT
jgi:glycosyltransferase involved in cell wall biosynthesis